MEQQVLADVDKAYQLTVAARQVLNLYSSATLERSATIRETVNYSYVRGEASLLELIEAQRSSAQTVLLNNQAKATYLNAYWQLQAAVGKPF